jgi:hypothetical protein
VLSGEVLFVKLNCIKCVIAETNFETANFTVSAGKWTRIVICSGSIQQPRVIKNYIAYGIDTGHHD